MWAWVGVKGAGGNDVDWEGEVLIASSCFLSRSIYDDLTNKFTRLITNVGSDSPLRLFIHDINAIAARQVGPTTPLFE
jgi:hypothetical protein